MLGATKLKLLADIVLSRKSMDSGVVQLVVGTPPKKQSANCKKCEYTNTSEFDVIAAASEIPVWS
jgi:hypothetical protein